MKVLLVGSGGREHALAWAIRNSPRCDALLAAPGNPGIAALARCLDVSAEDVDGLARAAVAEDVGLVVVGPEAPLAKGLADRLAEARIPCFGPPAVGARLESSKIFAKELMRRHQIPTGRAQVFDDAVAARATLAGTTAPLVVKADGLCGGKGVTVCQTAEEALSAVDAALVEGRFGEAGRRVLVEDFLAGEEVSIQALTDGASLLFLATARDHKRIGDGDTGPNTGGMGAVSPAPGVSEALRAEVERDVFVPLLHALREEGIPFRGVLYAGLMLTRSGPKVLEWNVRFGDPETQVILPRFGGDFLVALHAAATGHLERVKAAEEPRPAVAVVAAAAGYPGKARTGDAISGLERAESPPDVLVFQAGTARREGRVVTSGGRVLSVMARGGTVPEARKRAYEALGKVSFTGMYFRRDIAGGGP